VLREQSSASSTTLTVPFGVHRERGVHDLRGSFVGNGSEFFPLFEGQIVFGEELKTLRDEKLTERELLEQKALTLRHQSIMANPSARSRGTNRVPLTAPLWQRFRFKSCELDGQRPSKLETSRHESWSLSQARPTLA
jgi:hypothetical protein